MFVESYGKVAVQGSSFSPRVDAVLDRGTAELRGAGFSARSAFLTSPTFGGISWLAHSTLQTGVWIDSQRRYDQLIDDGPPHPQPGVQARRVAVRRRHAGEQAGVEGGLDLLPLRQGLRPPQHRLPRPDASACRRCPTSTRCWPCSGSSSPNATGRRSSPRSTSSRATRRGRASRELIAWDEVGDGSIFGRLPAAGAHGGRALQRRRPDARRLRAVDRVLAAHARSRSCGATATTTSCSSSWATISPRRSSPARAPSHDVPISVIAHDPKVMDRIAGWGWQDGLRPSPQAPVWPMDAFRDRFLTAFGSSPAGR